MTEQALELRQLGAEDLAEAWGIESQVFADEPWTKEQLAAELVAFDGYYAGLFLDGRLCGFGGIRGFHEADIMTLGVVPEARGKGFGSLILNDLLGVAKQRNWDPIFLEVRESNRAARALYRNAGFVELGSVRNYYRNPVEDAVRMGLTRRSTRFS